MATEASHDLTGPDFETLETRLDVNYTWGYEETRAELRRLYRKAQRGQWIPDQELDFETVVDPSSLDGPIEAHPLFGSEIYDKLSQREHEELAVEINSWTLSQFLHGEQGALLAAAQLACSVPDIDSKLFAGTQVVDEGRHIEVFARYLERKVGVQYPVSPHLKKLLDFTLKDSRWDVKCLGMQIMVEGLALSAFGLIRSVGTEPLLASIIRYVMADEARHVAYGLLSLNDFYTQLPERERSEREDIVYESARLMRDRFLLDEVWEKHGMPVERCREIVFHNPAQKMFRTMLFSKIVPAVKRVGLLSDRQRERFAELGILAFENAPDPFADLESP